MVCHWQCVRRATPPVARGVRMSPPDRPLRHVRRENRQMIAKHLDGVDPESRHRYAHALGFKTRAFSGSTVEPQEHIEKRCWSAE